MTTFDTEFVMELFLDDTVSTMNRLIVATANVLNDNLENMSNITDTLIKEHNDNLSNITTIPRRSTTKKRRSRPSKVIKNFYESIVKNFTDADYIKKLKISKATVQVRNFFQILCSFYCEFMCDIKILFIGINSIYKGIL